MPLLPLIHLQSSLGILKRPNLDFNNRKLYGSKDNILPRVPKLLVPPAPAPNRPLEFVAGAPNAFVPPVFPPPNRPPPPPPPPPVEGVPNNPDPAPPPVVFVVLPPNSPLFPVGAVPVPPPNSPVPPEAPPNKPEPPPRAAVLVPDPPPKSPPPPPTPPAVQITSSTRRILSHSAFLSLSFFSPHLDYAYICIYV